MTLHLLRGSWLTILYPPSGEFRNVQKGFIPVEVHSLLPDLTYPQWYTMLPLVHLIQLISKGLPDSVTRSKLLTL